MVTFSELLHATHEWVDWGDWDGVAQVVRSGGTPGVSGGGETAR